MTFWRARRSIPLAFGVVVPKPLLSISTARSKTHPLLFHAACAREHGRRSLDRGNVCSFVLDCDVEHVEGRARRVPLYDGQRRV